MKVCGAVLIMAASLFAAAGAVRRLDSRVRALEGLVLALGILRGEISGRMTPLADAFARLGSEAPEPVCRLFQNAERALERLGEKPFGELWQESVRATPELLLTREEERSLAALGPLLGRYSVEEQAAALREAQARFNGYLETAREARRRDGRVEAAFSAAAGLLVVILLL